jgi:hypothetical protein
MALITNRNKPKVTIEIGSVSKIKMGLTIALTKPKITAAIRAATKFLTRKPGTKLAVITNANAASSQVNKKCGMTFVE